MFERFQELLERLTELESGRRETTADVLNFHHRLRDIEARLPPPAIPVVTPVTFSTQEQQAPAPDYRIAEPAGTAGGSWPLQARAILAPEPCGCDETVELRRQLAAANALLGRIGVYADTYGKDLVPTGPDSYGEGVRAVKGTIKAMLSKVEP